MSDRSTRLINGREETVVSVDLMKRSDAYTINNLISAPELMYRAAKGVYDAMDWAGRIAIVAGGGNNGGDGMALACILLDHGIRPKVFRTSDKLTDVGKLYLEKAAASGIRILPFTQSTSLEDFDIIIDCILGTGFSGTIHGLARAAIQAVNAAKAYVVSVDINSGINGDTGEAELAVKSDLTVSISHYKQGMFTGDAGKYIGSMVNVDIGIELV